MIDLLLKVGLAYLLGSVIGALWVGRFLGHVDIRTMGSGNAGGTNALRTQGWLFALLVVIVDVGKGMLATAWLPFVTLPGVESSASAWLTVACGAAAVAGHVFPVFHGFKGGKGAATLVGALVFLSWQTAVALVLAWLLIVGLSGYVGLATMSATVAAAVYAGITAGIDSALFVFLVVMSLFIVFTHRSNISRMHAGTENRMRNLMRRRRQQDPPRHG